MAFCRQVRTNDLNAIGEPISTGDQGGIEIGHFATLVQTFNLMLQSAQVYLFIFHSAVVAGTEMMLRKAK
jgi:hypothetical protein